MAPDSAGYHAPMRSEPTRRYRTLGRSVRLFRSFLVEQTDPERFYTDLAEDTAELVRRHEPLTDRTVVDVGAGQPAYPRVFAAAGASYIAVDVDRDALHEVPGTVRLQARGESLPLADGVADIVLSSNVMEHVEHPGVLGEEMLRVARPGGLVVISSRPGPRRGAGTRPRRGTGWAATSRPAATPGATATRRRTDTARPCTPPGSPTGCAGRARARTPGVVEAVPRYHPEWAGVVMRPARGAGGRGLEPPARAPAPMTRGRPRGPAPARGGPSPRVRGGVVGARRADVRGHEERPLRRPVGLPREGGTPLGPAGDLGRAPEPGLRLPLPDGALLRRPRRGRAGLGGAASVVGRHPRRGPAHRTCSARGAGGGEPDSASSRLARVHPEPSRAVHRRWAVVRGAPGAPRAGDPPAGRARDAGPGRPTPGGRALRPRGPRVRRRQRDGDDPRRGADGPVAGHAPRVVAEPR